MYFSNIIHTPFSLFSMSAYMLLMKSPLFIHLVHIPSQMLMFILSILIFSSFLYWFSVLTFLALITSFVFVINSCCIISRWCLLHMSHFIEWGIRLKWINTLHAIVHYFGIAFKYIFLGKYSGVVSCYLLQVDFIELAMDIFDFFNHLRHLIFHLTGLLMKEEITFYDF